MTAVSAHRVPVLMYHEISDETKTQDPFAVAPKVFAEQLAYLHDQGFTTLTAGKLAEILTGGAGDLPENPIVLTFDDGYGDFYTDALPVLQRHGFTGTLFQTTGWVGEEDEAKRMLNWRELAELNDAGIEIGAHTVRHPQLDLLAEDVLREELGDSKKALEDNLGFEVPGLAYPFGYSSEKVREVAREFGYTYAYAVGNDFTRSGDGKFTLPRLTVRRVTTMDEFRRMVGGKDTLAVRKDRLLTKGYSQVRRTMSALGVARQPSWYLEGLEAEKSKKSNSKSS
jgi:peptidoglycan/xylan/chitin deacetylase (PgdA/CDA1 family)